MKKQQLIVGGVVIAIVAIIIILYNKIIKSKLGRSIGQSPVSVKPGSVASSSSGFCKYGDVYPLQYGSCGNKVKELQKLLGVTVDGQFGPKTQAAVLLKFKKTTVLESDLVGTTASSSPSEIKAVSSAGDVTKLVVDINADLSSIQMTGRRNVYPWDVLSAQSVEDLRTISDKYKSTYGKDLYTEIDNAVFNFTTDVDNKIMSGLKAAQALKVA